MRAALFAFLALFSSACGSRSNLGTVDATGAVSSATGAGGSSSAASGGGGAGGTGGSTSSSSSSSNSTGSGPACSELKVVEPVMLAPFSPPVRAPEIGFAGSGNDLFLAFVQAPKDKSGVLVVSHADPMAGWPLELSPEVELWPDVMDFVTGPGPKGPVAALTGNGAGFLATTFLPQIDQTATLLGSDHTLFAQAIEDRYLAALVNESPTYEVLHVGSYQPSSLPQSEDPLVCIKRSLGAAVPSGTGFLAAFNEPGDGKPSCDPMSKAEGTTIALMRYEAPKGPGSFLVRTDGDTVSMGEPLVHVALSPASFGGWLVYQTDGSTARFPPPVVAVRVDPSGKLLDPKGPWAQVSPGGQISQEIAVASLGDILAVAWVDSLDPSAPTIIVQLVLPGVTLGAATSIPTNAAWLSGRLRMAPSPDLQHLFLAWESNFDKPGIGLARIDCSNSP